MTHQLLNRISFGPTKATKKRLQKLGYAAFLEEQLHPSATPVAAVEKRKKQYKFVVKRYQNRSFTYYDAPPEKSWALLSKNNFKDMQQPAAETLLNSCLHALYSPWQLQELVVQFWHHHFSISITANNQAAVSLPRYDKTIRQHAFGNFRHFLEAIAKSPTMLCYLGNVSSRASPANENFARELFELHTMGEEGYVANEYTDWKDVPGAKEGKAIGYLENDVYEAARAFTGWTVADGAPTHSGAEKKPNTGEFLYLESWHDDYQKRVMGVEIPNHQAPLQDGQKVLDLVAAHEKTAQFICTKLCRYFIADTPPPQLVARAAALWQTQQDAPDQIRQVLRLILSAEEFHASLGGKFKKPNELLLSLFRSLEVEVLPNMHLHWMLKEMGQPAFAWPAPNGFPDRAQYWSSGNLLLQRWNVMPKLFYSNWHLLFDDFDQLLPDPEASSAAVVQQCLERLLGQEAADKFPHRQRLVDILLREGRTADQVPLTYNEEDKRHQFAQIWAFVAMTPDFQYR